MKKFPNSFVILLSLICLACAMTWLIPAGSYEKFMDASGITQISTDSFIFVEQTPVNPFELPFYVVEGFVKNVDLILILLFSGGAFEIVNASGALQALITNIASAFQTKKILLLIILTTAFAVVCSSQALHVFIPFVPILVMLTVSLGYDSITGAAIVILGGGIGFSTGTIRTTTTLVAQKIAGLPLYSGLGFRIVCLVVFLIPTCAYLCWYAKRIENKPEASPMYDLDSQLFTSEDRKKGADSVLLTMRQKIVLLALIVSLVLMVYGSLVCGWGVRKLAAVFLIMGIVVGMLQRQSADEMVKCFMKGSSSMLSAAFLVGLGTSISLIFSDGGITDTIIYALTGVLSMVPEILQAACMYIANTIVNVFITSGTAQASVVMPIFIPVADALGMTRQTAVVAYNFGDGFCNYILPTSSALMGVLGAARIPYDRWLKFMWKAFAIWAFVSCIMCTIAQEIALGPF